MRTTVATVLALLAGSSALSLLACSPELEPSSGDYTKVDNGKADASEVAIFLDLEFDGELFTTFSWNVNSLIEDQLLYTIGHLNGDNSVGRLDKVVLTDVVTEEVEGGTRVTYHAVMPVAWGDKLHVPSSYTLRLPRDMSHQGTAAFTNKYNHACVDSGAHDVTSGSMWYYYRPNRSACNLEDADIVTIQASLAVSDINTTGKFPEYDKVWEDGSFRAVVVFGKYEDDATTSSDHGISAYNEFVKSVDGYLSQYTLTTVPADVPSSPGTETPEVVFSATLADGKSVQVVAILVDNVQSAGSEFNQRYEELSERADLIVYNGHAGLGSNIRALARKGRWVSGQYVIVFMNGCDTYAYVDSAIFDAHRDVNDNDPNGTKHADMVTNAQPAFFSSMPDATMALVRGLTRYQVPQTYEQMFKDVDSSQVILVSGEQDNEYVPGGGDEPGLENWEGLVASGAVAKYEEQRWETPRLAAGRYRFELSGDHDADLYLRIGEAPTEKLYDCRPYKNGSDEICEVELPIPSTLHVMVLGFASSSTFELVGTTL